MGTPSSQDLATPVFRSLCIIKGVALPFTLLMLFRLAVLADL